MGCLRASEHSGNTALPFPQWPFANTPLHTIPTPHFVGSEASGEEPSCPACRITHPHSPLPAQDPGSGWASWATGLSGLSACFLWPEVKSGDITPSHEQVSCSPLSEVPREPWGPAQLIGNPSGYSVGLKFNSPNRTEDLRKRGAAGTCCVQGLGSLPAPLALSLLHPFQAGVLGTSPETPKSPGAR